MTNRRYQCIPGNNNNKNNNNKPKLIEGRSTIGLSDMKARI